jgi:hexokinase
LVSYNPPHVGRILRLTFLPSFHFPADYLADSVDAFLTEYSSAVASPNPIGEQENPFEATSLAVPLGLTFSFPVEQTALNKGKILTWTKGFAARNAVGNDVVKLLQDAFDRKHLHVRCVALVNDVGSSSISHRCDVERADRVRQTVGTLLSRAYTAGSCILGKALLRVKNDLILMTKS